MTKPHDKTDWEERYTSAGDDYLFGKDPNEFLAAKKEMFSPGQTAICIADGEGRNSVWLAQKGLHVHAVEYAHSALAKARRLANESGVIVEYQHANILDDQWPGSNHSQYDWVIAVFIQFAKEKQQEKQFSDLKRLCKPGGNILLVGYTPLQLQYGTGGPSAIENLYTSTLLKTAFHDFDITLLEEYEKNLTEGSRHQGMSALIGMIATRRL
ncbi:class I SAM-dependent methyltransferase [uncultured Aquitalea sp.]|uniref:class I SAM-dependent methyltransferase n=1 Tax=uncultured Aquitalea sp. TaxID=540272 RepID=UPI0025D78D4B|nr:class I SAM-dependent methyltransferase [uncultured Aquitalea sp.]